MLTTLRVYPSILTLSPHTSLLLYVCYCLSIVCVSNRYLLYFPFVGEKETLPSLIQNQTSDSVDIKNNKQSPSLHHHQQLRGKTTGGRGTSNSKNKSKNSKLSEVIDDEGLDNRGGISDNLVHVFWMGRYLPRGLGGRDEMFKWMKPRKV